MDETAERRLNRHWNCRLTATGRRSGQPRSVTIWFVLEEGMLFLAGGAEVPHWCRNLDTQPSAEAVIGHTRLRLRAKVLEEGDPAEAVRRRFLRKYLLARISRWFGGYTRSVAVELEIVECEEVQA
ncbi:MAG: nitroreductase/quinone reductase family protein [Myxococcota bacterium]